MMVSWAAKNALILFKTLGALVSRQTRERNELVTNVGELSRVREALKKKDKI